MKVYTQITKEEGYQIYSLMKSGHSIREISAVMEFNKTTINQDFFNTVIFVDNVQSKPETWQIIVVKRNFSHAFRSKLADGFNDFLSKNRICSRSVAGCRCRNE